MARMEDTRAGWEIYKTSGFSLDLDQVNERLKSVGFAEVKPRSWQHWQKLRRGRFERYITMNRLDLMEMPDPFFDETLQERYAYSDADVPTRIVVHRRDSTLEVITEMSHHVVRAIRASDSETKDPDFNVTRVISLVGELEQAFQHLLPRTIELPPAPEDEFGEAS